MEREGKEVKRDRRKKERENRGDDRKLGVGKSKRGREEGKEKKEKKEDRKGRGLD